VLELDAKIVYISESVHDLLGYEPSDVIGKSPFDYFIGKQAEAARKQHGRGVQMDKAAVLTKWNLRAKNGEIIPCECVFTVVYSVVVAATSLLRKETFGKS
jgi:PAS domain S-box-containing protein